jgi:protocatechuate 3,4-dioxygenase beta subunit
VTLPGAGEGLVFVLERACRVSGVVLDPAGVPVAGARVETGLGGGLRGAGRLEQQKRRRTTSDAEGRFALPDVPAASTVIHASAEGWARSEPLPIQPVPAGAIEGLVLRLSLGGALTGEVYGPGGAPLASVRVRYTVMGSGDGGVETTDAHGRFRAEHLTPGLYQVMVEPDPQSFIAALEKGGEEPDMGKIFEELKMTSADVRAGETAHVVLGAEPQNPVQVYGRLTEAGEPVAGRMVIAMAEGEQVMSSMRMARTDDDGAFELELKQPGPVVFSVQLDGGGNPQFFEDAPEQEAWHVELELPTGRISGTVFAPDGKPAAGIPVRITGEDGFTPTLIGLSNRVVTDAEGRYAFQSLEPGAYSVRAGGSMPFGGGDGAYGTQIASGVELAEGSAREGVDLHLARSGRVEGRVIAAGGEPAGGAAVFVRDAGGRLLSPFTGCTSDASGRFVYEGIAPGRVTVSARHGAEASAESPEVLVREGEASQVDLRLQPGTFLIVTLESESGVAQRAQVRVVDEEGRELGSMVGPDQLERSLASGFSSREHRIGPLPEGRYHVIATGPSGAQSKKPVTLRGQEERRLRMRIE